MFRKVVFSKEPTVLSLESLDDSGSAFISLKQKHTAFQWGSQRENFGLYKIDPKNGKSDPYFVIRPGESNASACVFSTPSIKTQHIATQSLKLTAGNAALDATASLDATIALDANSTGLLFQIPNEEQRIVFQHNTHSNSPWLAIGRRGVGIGTVPHPLASLYVKGTVVCDHLVCLEDSEALASRFPPTPTPPSIPLDANGKIPMSYLPEVYQTSLIQNDIGVGIGTQTPCQKFHLEGTGYIRDRLGVGTQRPTATLDIHTNEQSTLPAMAIRAGTSHPSSTPLMVLEATTPVATFEPNNIHFHVSTEIPRLFIENSFEVKDQLYRRPTGWIIPDSLDVQQTLYTTQLVSIENKPFSICAPIVSMAQLKTAEWERPLNSSADIHTPSHTLSSTEIKELFSQMSGLNTGICGDLKDAQWDWDISSWKNAYEKGQEVAQWLLKKNPDSPDVSLRVSSTVAFLWAMVQHLNKRVERLEEEKKKS
jgi:hypothetical protein